jgi:stage II sporulation protein R
VQSNIAGSILRLHIIANSNSLADQRLKLTIRDKVIKTYGYTLSNINSKAMAKDFLNKNLDNIKSLVLKEIEAAGYNYAVRVSIDKSDFPTKTYTDTRLPAGSYEALKIHIGNGDGENWWCVMYPPLCFIDITKKDLVKINTDLLKNALSTEELKIVKSKNSRNIPIKIKFKIIEFWQELGQKLSKS